MVCFVLRKVILQMLDVWFLFWPFIYFHTSCVWTGMALARQTAQMRRLAWSFAGCQCDKYHNLMSWLISNHYLARDTGHSRYVDFAYLDTTTYVEVIFHSQHFSLYFFAFQLRLCRKRLTRSNGYLEVIFHALNVFSIIFASVYCRSIKSALTWAPYCLLRLCTCISWGANIFQTTIKIT